VQTETPPRESVRECSVAKISRQLRQSRASIAQTFPPSENECRFLGEKRQVHHTGEVGTRFALSIGTTGKTASKK